MAKLIRMPEIAANATSAVIQSWVKKEGDHIKVGDVLAEIETDKALIEFDVDEAGILAKILAPEGQDVAVGAPIAVLFAEGESGVNIDALLAEEAGLAATNVSAEAVQEEVKNTSPLTTETAIQLDNRIFVSPLARRLAKERGIALDHIKGSGPHGRIVKRDIDAANSSKASVSALPSAKISAPIAGESAYIEIPHSGMRKTIARRLTESKTTVPHFYLRADCNMDKLIALRHEINAAAPRKISINDFIVKAAAAALREMPDMNVSWTETALRQYEQVDISVAVSTDTGLITPVVRTAGTKSLTTISENIAELASRARSNQLQPNEYQGGSFTISNLGMFGVQDFAAIINPPQSAILAVGATTKRPVVINDELTVASMMTVTLSVDHRAVDGALAAQWLSVFQRYIENPLTVLI